MKDYLDHLFDYILLTKMAQAPKSPAYLLAERAVARSCDELYGSLSPEQRRLFRLYEDAENRFHGQELSLLFRETFALSRAVYR